MIASGQFVARLITASTPGIAAIAAQRLLDRRPDIVMRFGPDARSCWRESNISRLGYLSAALATAAPSVLAEQVAWARTAYQARGGPDAASDFDEAMLALCDVLRQELPGESGSLAANFLDLAMKSIATHETHAGLKTPHRQLVAGYLLAILEGDRRQASQIILEALQPGLDRPALTVREIYLSVLIPAQVELGRMWHLNEIGVAEEHFATATTQMAMAQLYERLPFAAPNGKTVVAAAVEGNAHEIAVRMLGDLLESAGWRTIYLGASVPGPDLADAVQHFGADVAALSAGLGSQLPVLADAVSRIKALPRPVKVLVGGGAFPINSDSSETSPLWRRLGADGFAVDLDEAVVQAARLVGLRA